MESCIFASTFIQIGMRHHFEMIMEYDVWRNKLVMSERAFNDAKLEIRNMLKEAKYPQARIFATQLIKNFNNDAELFYLRGTACAHRSATEQAEKDLRAAIALQPKSVDYYLTLCNLLFSTGKYERALSEYVRVKNMSPNSAKIKAFAKIVNGANGKLDKALVSLEVEYKATHYKVKIAEQLVSLYLVKAVFGWHARHQDKSLVFYATNTTQLQQAEYFLEKIRLLPVTTNTIRQKRSKLENLISMSWRKRYDGFFSDRILSVAIVAIGIIGGGLIDWIYALSAVASFGAYLRPNYILNRVLRKKSKSSSGKLNAILDFSYGENIRPENKIFSGISDANVRFAVANVLRSLVRCSVLPLAVFAGFFRNFGMKYAVWFAAAISLVVIIFVV